MMVRRFLLVLCCIIVPGCSRSPVDVHIAISTPILDLSPIPNDQETALVTSNIYEGLVGYSPTMEIIPLLATSWETLSDVTWKFRLRKDVYFHDGSPMTSEDVVTSIQHMVNAKDHILSEEFKIIQTVTATEPGTVTITTSRPFSGLLHLLTAGAILPADDMEGSTGTGPYRVKKLSENEVQLAAFSHYWAGCPDIDTLTFFLLDSDRTLADFSGRSGKYIFRDALRLLEKPHPDFLPRESLGLTVIYIGFNIAKSPFTSPELRKAIFLGIDRKSLVQQRYGHRALPTCQPVPFHAYGFHPGLSCTYDPEQARKSLSESGLPLPVHLTVLTAGRGERTMTMVSEQLSRIGIDLSVKLVPWNELLTSMLNGEAACYFTGHVSGFGNGLFTLDSLFSSHGASNTFGYADPEVDRLIHDAYHAMDDRKRLTLLQKIEERVIMDAPMIPLANIYETYAVSRELDWEPRPDGLVLGKEIGLK
ncbi:MAG TPA: ABC transporter substrate-binding protein [Thermoanaerobaculia bacterium]|nr:ABC transporter substrate-binding protein [Thermoanaerobaculia bacterium]HXK66731.1 ABC transporter substrate-binding protein [Thermoanaerobaculia bacterium]